MKTVTVRYLTIGIHCATILLQCLALLFVIIFFQDVSLPLYSYAYIEISEILAQILLMTLMIILVLFSKRQQTSFCHLVPSAVAILLHFVAFMGAENLAWGSSDSQIDSGAGSGVVSIMAIAAVGSIVATVVYLTEDKLPKVSQDDNEDNNNYENF